ncbi:hypothetical protein [Nocardia tengchongensis]|uniref:hypothetical protein n=1 Tax=Nocardia tengchongensis TaxID=2055889 RepID=UPI003659DA3F
MSGGDDAMIRWLPRPVPVLIDPKSLVALPKHPKRWTKPNQLALGVAAGGVDLQLADQWIPGTVDRWLRTKYGFWLGRVSYIWQSPNSQLAVQTTQWVAEDGLQLGEERIGPPRT